MDGSLELTWSLIAVLGLVPKQRLSAIISHLQVFSAGPLLSKTALIKVE